MARVNDYNWLDYFDEYFKGGFCYNPKDKEKNRFIENLYTLNQVAQIFTYENLPDTIPQRVFERYLLLNGSALFIKKDGEFFIMQGGKGGILNYNYEPTMFVFSNPYLRLSGNFKVENEPEVMNYPQYANGEGILIRNDTNSMGVYPLIDKYNCMLTELDLTIYRAIINMRTQALVCAPSMPTTNAVNEWYQKLEAGDEVAVFDMSFEDGDNSRIKAQPLLTSAGSNYITSLIELKQYIQSSRDNKLGINCNFNMKREALSTAECTLNDQSVIPLVLDMFNNRLDAVEKINEKFGLNIKVKLNNLWAENIEPDEEEPTEEDGKEVTEEESEDEENAKTEEEDI